MRMKGGDVVVAKFPKDAYLPYVAVRFNEDSIELITLREYIEKNTFVEINGEYTSVFDYIESQMEIYMEEHEVHGEIRRT